MNWIIEGSPHVSKIDKPKTFFLTEFDGDSIKALDSTVGACLANGQPLLPIFIESYGGAVNSMAGILSIIDKARDNGLRIATIVNGMAYSCGALVFCYGDADHRYIGSYGSLMIHNFSTGSIGKVNEGLDHYLTSSHLESSIFDRVGKHLKKPKDWIKKRLEKKKNYDWFLTPEEAVAEGLASKIDSPNFVFSLEEKFAIR